MEEAGPCVEMISAVAPVLFPWRRSCLYTPKSNNYNNYKLLWERGLRTSLDLGGFIMCSWPFSKTHI